MKILLTIFAFALATLTANAQEDNVRPVINGTNSDDHEAYHSMFDDSLEWHHAGISILPTIDYLRRLNLTEDDICVQFNEQYNLWGTKEKNGKTIPVFSQPFWDMVHDVIADGISEVTVEEKSDNNMYLPDGRRIAEKPQKGIYIKNGQKRVAK